MKIKPFSIAVVAALVVCGCLRDEKAAQTARGPLWTSVGSQYIGRIKDPETGVVCYVTGAGGIDCIKEEKLK